MSSNLWDFITDQVNRHGQGTLADKIGVDGSTLSKFRSGDGALRLEPLEELLEQGGAVITTKADIKRLEDAFETATDLWKAAKNHNQLDKT